MNLIEGQLKHEGGQARFTVGTLTIDLPLATATLPNPGSVLCGFRPEDARRENGGPLRGKVTSVESLGSTTYAQIEFASHDDQLDPILLTIQLDPNATPPNCGDEIRFAIEPECLYLFDPTTGNRL
jgi:ABC-type sugar transport system ATPase subunit